MSHVVNGLQVKIINCIFQNISKNQCIMQGSFLLLLFFILNFILLKFIALHTNLIYNCIVDNSDEKVYEMKAVK